MYYRLLTLTLLQLQCYFINTQELSLLEPEKIVFVAPKYDQRPSNSEDIKRRSQIDNNFMRLGRSGRFSDSISDDLQSSSASDDLNNNYFARLGRGGDTSEDAFVRLGKSEASFMRLGRAMAKAIPLRGTRFNGNEENIIRIGKRGGYDDFDDIPLGLYGSDMALRRFKRNQPTTTDKSSNDEIKKDHSNSKSTVVDNNKKKCPLFIHV